MKKKTYIISLAAMLLALSFIFTAIPVSAASGEYDLSRPASSHGKVLDTADILEEYLGTPLSAEERAYLAAFGELRLLYDTGITTSRVVTSYENGTLNFSVLEYSYLTGKGVTVTWIPRSVTLGDRTNPLTKDGAHYLTAFDGVAEEDGLLAYVDYTLDVELSREDMNSVINKAYLDAPRLKSELAAREAEYLRLSEQYAKDLISYDEYLEAMATYEADLAVYTDYLTSKKLYDDALAEYNAYLEAMEDYHTASEKYAEYERLLAEYNSAYVKYRDYLTALEDYNGRLDEYNDYLDKITLVKAQLAVIEAAKTPMTDKREVYSAIMGTLVTQVVENKDLIASSLVGAKEQVIDDAGRATTNLRTLLKAFFSLSGEQERYAYYTVNYEEFRDNFTLLLKSLDELYRNKRVRGTLIAEGKDKKYIILVAQLAIISNALSGEPVSSYYGEYLFDGSYKIEKQTIGQILENKEYFLDTGNPEPLSDGYPAAVSEPVAPEYREEPKKPQAVPLPTLPEEVDDPGNPPDEVDEPTRPDEVKNPTPPERYIPAAEVTGLISLYDKGGLAPREELSEDVTLTLTHRLKKQVFGASSVTVEFRDEDGKPLYVTSVDRGSAADYEGIAPTRAEDASATYTFDCWVDENGNPVSLDEVESDLVLYPSFKTNVKRYTVTFITDGSREEYILAYGTMPEYLATPHRSPTASTYFSFSGWSSPLAPVTGNAEYTALFDEHYYLSYPEGGGADLRTEEGFLIADSESSVSSRLDLSVISRHAHDLGMGLILETRFSRITLTYATLNSLLENGDTFITLSVVQNGIYGYTYRISLANADGVAKSAYRLWVSTPSRLSDPDRSRLFYSDTDGTRVYSTYSYKDGVVSYYHSTDKVYTLLCEYSVNLIPSDRVELISSHIAAKPGEWVYVSVGVPKGIELERVYLTLDDGTELEIMGGKFRMPSSDISIGVSYRTVKYRVTFMNKDKVIISSLYEYGDTVIPPAPPERMNSEFYSYTFRGWSPEILTVTADAVYRAEYDLHLLPLPEKEDGLQISEGIMRLIVLASVGVGVLLFVLIPASVMSGIRVSRYKKWRRGDRQKKR